MKLQQTNHKTLLKQLVRENIKSKLIYEGLIFSYPPMKIFPKLKRMDFDKVHYNKERNIFNIKFKLNKNNKIKYKELDRFMNNVCGWHHGSTIDNKKTIENKIEFLEKNEGYVILQYEAKFDIETVIDKVIGKIYHLTTENKLNKILKQGLTPRSSTKFFNYDNRIYFSLEKKVLYEFAKIKKTTKEEDFIILEINVKKLPSNIRFFLDPNHNNGIYTLENIPPNVINVLEKFAYITGIKIKKELI